jgi:hypothetical protein
MKQQIISFKISIYSEVVRGARTRLSQKTIDCLTVTQLADVLLHAGTPQQSWNNVFRYEKVGRHSTPHSFANPSNNKIKRTIRLLKFAKSGFITIQFAVNALKT